MVKTCPMGASRDRMSSSIPTGVGLKLSGILFRKAGEGSSVALSAATGAPFQPYPEGSFMGWKRSDFRT